MTMSMDLSHRLEQRLKMTAQMIQSIQMLQLPLLQLEQEINQHLEENPTLEMIEQEVEREPGEAEDEEKEWEAESDFEKLEKIASEDEWAEQISGESRSPKRFDGEPDAKIDAMQNTPAPEMTLRDSLLTQLHLLDLDDEVEMLAEEIIQSMDDNGYLQYPLEEIFPQGAIVRDEEEGEAEAGTDSGDEPQEARDGYVLVDGKEVPAIISNDTQLKMELEPTTHPPVFLEKAQEALGVVQSLDPPGVGARDVQECLMIQLRRDRGETAFEQELVGEHFDDLLNNRLPKVAKETGRTIDDIKDAMEIVAQLNPRPGSLFASSEQQRYIIPDVVVEEVDGEYQVRMNDVGTPRLRISRTYMDLMRQERRGSTTRDYIREKIQSAKWLIDAIEQRRNTLYKIACEIVGIQKEFFDKGLSALHPLMMQEVADRIGMHVSTVSRALTEKYMQTPRGLFPMKYFFTGGFESADGTAESNRAVMERIQKMIDAENKKSPLSDQEIGERLKKQGIDIARRTVAKYREKLGILSSRQRKQY